MSYEYINVDVEDRLYVVTINRPEVHNALSPDTNFELHDAFDRFESDPDLWVAIITGAGDAAFSVGGDISFMVDAKSEDDYRIPPSGYGGLTDRHSCHKPVIAAVNGMAFGGGFETALACDLIIASDTASFGLPEPKIGTAAVGSGVHRIVRDIGLKPAMALLLTGDPVDARRAFELGLVNEVVPADSLMATARAYAERILQCAPLAVQASKQCAIEGLRYDSVEAALDAQREGRFDRLDAMMKSDDVREGLTAFIEKRRPEWKGK